MSSHATDRTRHHFLALDGPARFRYGPLNAKNEPLFEQVPGWRAALDAWQAAIAAEEAEYHAARRAREAERRRLEGGEVGRRVWVFSGLPMT